jgi:uncharacterized LabA/DUF88 family protein
MCSAREQNANINYATLLNHLAGSYAWTRKPLVCAVQRPGADISNFQNNLKRLGAEVKVKEITYTNGKGKADFDLLIAAYCVEMAPVCDWIVLMTGDGDFVDLVHWLHQHSVKVELIAFENYCSRELKSVADKFTEINQGFLFNRHPN